MFNPGAIEASPRRIALAGPWWRRPAACGISRTHPGLPPLDRPAVGACRAHAICLLVKAWPIIARRDDIRVIVGFSDVAQNAADPFLCPFEDLQTVLIAWDQVLVEPRCSIGRMVWACRKSLVAPGNRVRIMHALSKSCDGLSLIDLGNVARGPEDPIDAILTLACEGHLAIDVSQPHEA